MIHYSSSADARLQNREEPNFGHHPREEASTKNMTTTIAGSADFTRHSALTLENVVCRDRGIKTPIVIAAAFTGSDVSNRTLYVHRLKDVNVS